MKLPLPAVCQAAADLVPPPGGTRWITWEKEPDFGTARRHSTEFIREAGLG